MLLSFERNRSKALRLRNLYHDLASFLQGIAAVDFLKGRGRPTAGSVLKSDPTANFPGRED